MRRPVAYASRSMTDTERRYAQIEKEALAITWACERFADYILGKAIQVKTDHKPLVPLLTSKQLDSLPARILRFCLRMDRFTYEILHVPGKVLNTPDTLSRAPLPSTANNRHLEELAELTVVASIDHLPCSYSVSSSIFSINGGYVLTSEFFSKQFISEISIVGRFKTFETLSCDADIVHPLNSSSFSTYFVGKNSFNE